MIFSSLAAAPLPDYYFGANAPHGFVNYFDQLYDPLDGHRAYILKGGPGTGKSSLMKKAADVMLAAGQRVELVHCSSDPDSLDAVLFPDIKTCIADGTAPHVMEPKYPGVCERLIHLGDCWDADQLEEDGEEIIAICRQNAALHARASRYITAAGSLLDDSFGIDCECCDLDAAEAFAKKLAASHFPKPNGRRGKESIRFLSAITPQGIVFQQQTLACQCQTIIAIEDEYGAAASIILSTLRSMALECGLSIITCPCAMAPKRKTDHIIIPSLSLAFCTANRYLPVTCDTQRRIHARRFRNLEVQKQRRPRLSFNRRAVYELLGGAVELLDQAKQLHDHIERYYMDAMDFEEIDRMTGKLIDELLQRVQTF